MIDIFTEHLLTFPEAAKTLTGSPHLSTLHRWRVRGVHGVRLESILVGGVRYTSREALQRFAVDTTAKADGQPSPSSSKQTETMAEADEEFDRVVSAKD